MQQRQCDPETHVNYQENRKAERAAVMKRTGKQGGGINKIRQEKSHTKALFLTLSRLKEEGA